MSPGIIAIMLGMCAGTVHAQPATWTMDPARSELRFMATFESSPAPGIFRKFDASVRFDPETLAGSRIDVVVWISSADMGNDDVNNAIRGSDWFDADRHPVAEFRAGEVLSSGPNMYVASGTLTLKGIAKPARVPFQWKQSGDTATMTGEVMIDRGAYGIGSGEWKSTAQIGGAVKANFSVQFRRRG